MVQECLKEKDLEEDAEHILPCGSGPDFFPGQLLMPAEKSVTPTDVKQPAAGSTIVIPTQGKLLLCKCGKGGTLLKTADGYICQECWAKEHGIELLKSKGHPVCCPRCGETLMTKYRHGKVSITSMSMRNGKQVLTCKCGYEKVVRNVFGRPPAGQARALQSWKQEEQKAKKEREEYLKEQQAIEAVLAR